MSRSHIAQSTRHDDEAAGGCKSHEYRASLLQAMVAILIGSFCLVLLSSLGLISSPAARCPRDFLSTDAGCQTRQDVKALVSFLLGALVIMASFSSPGSSKVVIWGSSETGFHWDLQGALTFIESCTGLI
eukprot:TRINITY_DN6563_c0_g9_i1.p1 TRINITY_DN6563_c0_g9~~TRINITY_DN6563_c0_g9_i1.p1  ORF type:complete len:130 (-),score=16.15 TRINITY_DN6563_c0_g9_i1:162-551(-)